MTDRIADQLGISHQLAHAITVILLLTAGYLIGRVV